MPRQHLIQISIYVKSNMSITESTLQCSNLPVVRFTTYIQPAWATMPTIMALRASAMAAATRPT